MPVPIDEPTPTVDSSKPKSSPWWLEYQDLRNLAPQVLALAREWNFVTDEAGNPLISDEGFAATMLAQGRAEGRLRQDDSLDRDDYYQYDFWNDARGYWNAMGDLGFQTGVRDSSIGIANLRLDTWKSLIEGKYSYPPDPENPGNQIPASLDMGGAAG